MIFLSEPPCKKKTLLILVPTFGCVMTLTHHLAGIFRLIFQVLFLCLCNRLINFLLLLGFLFLRGLLLFCNRRRLGRASIQILCMQRFPHKDHENKKKNFYLFHHGLRTIIWKINFTPFSNIYVRKN